MKIMIPSLKRSLKSWNTINLKFMKSTQVFMLKIQHLINLIIIFLKKEI